MVSNTLEYIQDLNSAPDSYLVFTEPQLHLHVVFATFVSRGLWSVARATFQEKLIGF